MRVVRLLPILTAVAFLSFTVRIGEVYYGFKDFGINNNEALAFTQAQESDKEPPAFDEKAIAENESDQKNIAEDSEYDAMDWRDSTEANIEFSDISVEMFEDLAERRKKLDKWEKELFAREALLKATEQELDRKYRELETLREHLENLLAEQSEEEDKRINSLVKVYEGMKAGDAARIFNSLDIDVLVDVVSRMSERKLSPILAEMNPERAKTITIILAQQKQLPDL